MLALQNKLIRDGGEKWEKVRVLVGDEVRAQSGILHLIRPLPGACQEGIPAQKRAKRTWRAGSKSAPEGEKLSTRTPLRQSARREGTAASPARVLLKLETTSFCRSYSMPPRCPYTAWLSR